ncbi:unnamed protein product [[Candida] boidinii]|nr:unnamed protein product [[Candida] boidinii]
MSAASESVQSEEVLSELFNKLTVSSPEEVDAAAANVSSFLNGSIIEHDVPYEFFQKLEASIKDKKSAVNALEAVAHIASEADLSPSVEPYIVSLIATICSKAGDKTPEIRAGASKALDAIAKAVTPVAIKDVLKRLVDCLSTTSKWQEKIAILSAISILVDTSKAQLALRMTELIPILSEAMWDTKVEVKNAATETMSKATSTIQNKDIEPFIPKLITSIANPNEVPETVHILGATTFVSEVTTAALSIMVPLLSRGLAERDTAIKRKAAVIIDNMCKLVDDPQVVAPFMAKLFPALKANFATIADPEARAVTDRALNTLRRVGAIPEDDSIPEVSTAGDVKVNYDILEFLIKEKKIAKRFEVVKSYIAAIAGDLIDERKIVPESWASAVSPFLTIFLHEKESKEIIEEFRKRSVDNIPQPPIFEDEDDEGEDLY